MSQLQRVPHQRLHLVIGTVNDKDVPAMLALLPAEGTFYFCAANIPRALPAGELAEMGRQAGLNGQAYNSVAVAVAAARAAAGPNDVVFIGGALRRCLSGRWRNFEAGPSRRLCKQTA